MKKTRTHTKVNIPMCAACVLLCLTLLSIHLSAGLYARYTASAEGSDSARVAKFEITETSEIISHELEVQLHPGTTSYPITVENKSEVVVEYSLSANNKTNNLPIAFSLTDADLDNPSLEIMPGETKSFNLNMYWSPESADAYIGMVDFIEVILKIEQID